MASNPIPDPFLGMLYQKLKDLDSIEQRLRQKIEDAVTDAVKDAHMKYLDLRRSEGNSFPEGNSKEPEQEVDDAQVRALLDEQLSLKFDPEIESLRDTIREQINICSRPHLRPLNILDMPDEILMEIFDHVRGPVTDSHVMAMEHHLGASEAGNLRLTCRRFCATSSHLLLRFVYVEMNSSSLSQFEEISRHPTISKGVLGIRVFVNFYDSELANHLERFAWYNTQKLAQETDLADGPDYPQLFNIPQDTLLRRVKEGEAILESWRRLDWGLHDDTNSEEDLCYRTLLQKCHEEYRRRFQDQERLLANGSFVHAVAAAMARMPCVKRLEFSDRFNFGRLEKQRSIYLEENDDGIQETLAENCVIPMDWEEPMLYKLGRPPVEILADILGATYKAGISLASLDIDISVPEYLSLFAPRKATLLDVKAAVQRLKKLKFKMRVTEEPPPWHSRKRQEIRVFKRFLRALLDTDSVESITLDFDHLCIYEGPIPSLGSILKHRAWAKLSNLYLSYIPLHLEELELFLDHQVPRSMSLVGPHLLSGTWAEALDILRKKSVKAVRLRIPWGAECEHMSYEEMRAIFGEDEFCLGPYNKAERYIRGWDAQNPLREPPAEESSNASAESSNSLPAEESNNPPPNEENNAD